MYFTKLRSFVKKRHNVFIEPEIHHAADRNRVQTYGVDLFFKGFLLFDDELSHPRHIPIHIHKLVILIN